MLVANIKIWKSHLNIREGSDYFNPKRICERKIGMRFSFKTNLGTIDPSVISINL